MATIRSISHNLGITDCDEATVRGKAMPDNLHLSISRDEAKDQVHYLMSRFEGFHILPRSRNEANISVNVLSYLSR